MGGEGAEDGEAPAPRPGVGAEAGSGSDANGGEVIDLRHEDGNNDGGSPGPTPLVASAAAELLGVALAILPTGLRRSSPPSAESSQLPDAQPSQ